MSAILLMRGFGRDRPRCQPELYPHDEGVELDSVVVMGSSLIVPRQRGRNVLLTEEGGEGCSSLCVALQGKSLAL